MAPGNPKQSGRSLVAEHPHQHVVRHPGTVRRRHGPADPLRAQDQKPWHIREVVDNVFRCERDRWVLRPADALRQVAQIMGDYQERPARRQDLGGGPQNATALSADLVEVGDHNQVEGRSPRAGVRDSACTQVSREATSACSAS